MANVYDLSNMKDTLKGSDYNVNRFKGLQAKIKLCTVPWDQHGNNVIDWKSNEQRNEYFDQLEGHVFDQSTNWNYKNLEVWKAGLGKHAGDIRVPLPYAEGIQFNYVFVELYEVPVEGGNIERRETYFYFLNGLESKAASTTLLALELDTWTTYWPSVSVAGINLNRGHYFHAKAPAVKFLENPIENSLGLTELEPDLPSLQPKVAHSELVSFAKSEPRICVATTGDFTDRRSWFTIIPTGPENEPDARPVSFPAATTPGSQDAPWNPSFDNDRGDYNTTDTVGLKSSVKQMQNGSGSPETLNVYSMTPADYLKFVAYARQDMIQIIDSVKAVYVLDSALINEGGAFTQWGVSFKKVSQSADPKLIGSFSPTQEMFAYPDIAKDFAKLYTRQFARLEISNLQGQKAEISIEEIAETIDVYARSSTLFPYLKLEALLDGVGGRGIKKYAVRPLGTMEASSFGGRWEDYLFDLDIPLFGITVARDQDVAQHDLPKRQQSARASKVEEVYRKARADAAWAAATETIGAVFTNAQADTELARLNETDRARVGYDNSILGAENARDIALANAMKDYGNSTAIINNAFDSGQLENVKALSNSQRAATTGKSNAGIAARGTISLAEISAVASRDTSLADLNMAWDHWKLAAMPIERERLIGKRENSDWNRGGLLNSMQDRWDYVWRSKGVLFSTLVEAARVTAGMGLLTSAQVAAYGAIGSGVSSLPGPSIGSSVEPDSSASGAASGVSGAFAGLASMNPVNMAFTLAINEKIWELQVKQINIQYAESANEYMELNGTTFSYRNRGTKHAEMDHNKFVSELDIEFQINSVFRDWKADQLTTDDIETRKFDVGNLNVATIYNATIQSSTIESGITIAVADNNYSLAMINSTADYDTRLQVLTNNRATDRFVQEADLTQSNLNATSNFETSLAIAIASRDLSITNLDRAYNTHTLANGRTAEASIFGIDTTLAMDYLGADTELGKSRGAWNSDLLSAVQGVPSETTPAAGKAWVDQWGLRGLEVRVLRCTDAVAEQAASTFMLYGYRAPALFVQNPTISMMTGFTYWEGEGLWLKGDLINESNKQILRAIFARGTTVWADPTLIFNIDITANRPIEEEA